MLKKIISGGQTGADQGGLLAAKELGLLTGGTAPKGFRTENGANLLLQSLFNLEEDSSFNYVERTYKNVCNSDGTIWFGLTNSPGAKTTFAAIKKYNKPYLVNPLTSSDFINWIIKNNISILNVAGNRESKRPGIEQRVKKFIITSLSNIERNRTSI